MGDNFRDLLDLEAIVDGTTKDETDGIELPLDVLSISASFLDLET